MRISAVVLLFLASAAPVWSQQVVELDMGNGRWARFEPPKGFDELNYAPGQYCYTAMQGDAKMCINRTETNGRTPAEVMDWFMDGEKTIRCEDKNTRGGSVARLVRACDVPRASGIEWRLWSVISHDDARDVLRVYLMLPNLGVAVREAMDASWMSIGFLEGPPREPLVNLDLEGGYTAVYAPPAGWTKASGEEGQSCYEAPGVDGRFCVMRIHASGRTATAILSLRLFGVHCGRGGSEEKEIGSARFTFAECEVEEEGETRWQWWAVGLYPGAEYGVLVEAEFDSLDADLTGPVVQSTAGIRFAGPK